MTVRLMQLIMSAIIGGLISYVITTQLMPIADKVQILYVAQDEIMAYENERLREEKLEDRQLFYGAVEQAVNLAASLPKAYQNRMTKIVYSMGEIKGENVRSISREIHKQIIRELSKNKDTKTK